MDSVYERSDAVLTVYFYDEDDAAVTPDSATWRIDDVTSGTAILAATAIAGLSTSVDLSITTTYNRILTETNPHEMRRVTIDAVYDTTKHMTGEFIYKVVNLYGVTTP